jgi:hypothetical protein
MKSGNVAPVVPQASRRTPLIVEDELPLSECCMGSKLIYLSTLTPRTEGSTRIGCHQRRTSCPEHYGRDYCPCFHNSLGICRGSCTRCQSMLHGRRRQNVLLRGIHAHHSTCRLRNPEDKGGGRRCTSTTKTEPISGKAYLFADANNIAKEPPCRAYITAGHLKQNPRLGMPSCS